MKACQSVTSMAFMLGLLGACAGGPSMNMSPVLTFTEADHGGSQQLGLGQNFEVKRLGTPTAGYVWEVQSLPTGIVLMDVTSQPQDPKGRAQGMVGGNDWTVFRFTTQRAPVDLQTSADQAVVLRYGRPWELEAGQPATRIWRLKITVAPGS